MRGCYPRTNTKHSSRRLRRRISSKACRLQAPTGPHQRSTVRKSPLRLHRVSCGQSGRREQDTLSTMSKNSRRKERSSNTLSKQGWGSPGQGEFSVPETATMTDTHIVNWTMASRWVFSHGEDVLSTSTICRSWMRKNFLTTAWSTSTSCKSCIYNI